MYTLVGPITSVAGATRRMFGVKASRNRLHGALLDNIASQRSCTSSHSRSYRDRVKERYALLYVPHISTPCTRSILCTNINTHIGHVSHHVVEQTEKE